MDLTLGRRVLLVPHGWICALANCPPGPFYFEGSIGFKTDYSVPDIDKPNTFWAQVFVLDSGEIFWGGVSDHRARERLMVQPLIIEVLEEDE